MHSLYHRGGEPFIELRKDISILNKSPKDLHKEARGSALGKSTIIFLSSERA